MAEEEQKHFDLFTKLSQTIDIEKQIQQQIKVPVEDHQIENITFFMP